MDLTDFINDEDEKLSANVRKAAHQGSFLPGRDEIGDDIHWGDTGAIDHVLQGRSIEGAATTSLRELTQSSRAANALKLPVTAGTRVSFQHNLGSVLAYAHIPMDLGTVVTVRSAGEDITVHNGMVMVAWDDGQFLPVSPEHLRLAKVSKKRASKVRRSFIEFSSISEMFSSRVGSTDLIHKATKDLWSFSENGGEFVIERLFSEDGNPLKM